MLNYLYIKYKSVIWYVFFGGCTTLVNIVMYAVCARVLSCGTATSNIVAWIISVLFAYVTNRKWVFNSSVSNTREVFKEIISFVSCRLLTGGIDLIIMIVSVDILDSNDLIMKIISNIVVIILNYVASKKIVFRDKQNNSNVNTKG